MYTLGSKALLGMLVLLIAESQVLCAQATAPLQEEVRETAEDVVRRLYDLVTFEPGTLPDWGDVRSLFVDEAVIVLRTSRTATTVFSLDGFVNDFVTFIERANAVETGFEERIIRLVPTEFHDMGHVWVLYEAHIPGSSRQPQQGVDSFSLIRRDGRWLIVSVTNDIPTEDYPIPAVLRE